MLSDNRRIVITFIKNRQMGTNYYLEVDCGRPENFEDYVDDFHYKNDNAIKAYEN